MFNPKGIPHIKIHTQYPTSLAIDRHPDLIPFLKSRNPPRIDSENRDLLFRYNHYIAQDLYGLNIEFSRSAIIPTPVMRYHFLRYVIGSKTKIPSQQIYRELTAPTHKVTIIELGTGASAIIALLAAKHFHARVLATEIDPDYLKIAQTNINRNKCEEAITLFPSDGNLLDGVVPTDVRVDYIISNPPYYDKVLSPKVIWGGKKHELVSEGQAGEAFILQMIEEGWKYLKPGGLISFLIPKTRTETLIAVERYLNAHNMDYDIIGLLVGNRTRYVFRITKPDLDGCDPTSEM